MASLLGYGKSDDRISVTFDGDAQRPRRRLSPNATPAPVFAAVEPVTGVVEIRVPAGKRLEHQGIKIECVGPFGGKEVTASTGVIQADPATRGELQKMQRKARALATASPNVATTSPRTRF